MKRSQINKAIREASAAFFRHGWILPPNPRWDVTDFGLGDFAHCGLVLVNLAEQAEYCEKIMYVQKNQITPDHYHALKKEDIICRFGELAIRFLGAASEVNLPINGDLQTIATDAPLILPAGWRVTITSEIRHEFWAVSDYAIVGEVSSANNDLTDNFFANRDVGRFSAIEEDEPALVKLVSD